MIVVDVNIVMYCLVSGQRTEIARKVYERDSDWWAPSMLPHEFLNIMATWYRKGLMNEHQCLNTWRDVKFMFEDSLVDPDWESSLKIALKHDISAYDAEYVETARARQLTLVTEDQELIRKFPAIAMTMADFLGNNN